LKTCLSVQSMSHVVAHKLRDMFAKELSARTRLNTILNRVGVCARKDAGLFLRANRVECIVQGKLQHVNARVVPSNVRVNGQPLRFLPPAIVALHKPAGAVCSRSADESEGKLVHEFFTPDFVRNAFRNHQIAGRLDRMASGLVVLTDYGLLNNFLRSRLPKVYEIEVVEPFTGTEAALFASGTLQLRNEPMPSLPADFVALSDRKARVTLYEGRYRQLRRMFGAVGNRIVSIHRTSVAGIQLGDLKPGQWRVLDDAEIAALLQQRAMPIPDGYRRAPTAPTKPRPLGPRRAAKQELDDEEDGEDGNELDFGTGEEDDEGMVLLPDEEGDAEQRPKSNKPKNKKH
jgi:16S rRNA pseudouridine516 synthase